MEPPPPGLYCHKWTGKTKAKTRKLAALYTGMRGEGGKFSGKSGLPEGITNNHRLEKYSGGEMWARQIPHRAQGDFPWHPINYITVASLNLIISCSK